MSVATMTRHNIANAVHSTAQVCVIPGVAHKKALEKIVQYVLRTAILGITYGGNDRGIEMLTYTDSDCATCPNTRRSVSSGAVLLWGGAICWHSRTQEVTASATLDSEYMALVKTVKDVLFLCHV